MHLRTTARLDAFQSFAQFNCVVTARSDLRLVVLNDGDSIGPPNKVPRM
jgi:hypothetical protein